MRLFTRAWLLALFLTAVAAILPATALAIMPLTGTTPTLTSVEINASAGDQTEPHVSGDWAAYTDDTAQTIRYYNFATFVDAEIPLNGGTHDMLSDVSGSKIVFSRRIDGRTTVMVFDASTPAAPMELDPTAGASRFGSAIGGNTVAYIDYGLGTHGELIIHDLLSTASVRITFDSAYDQNPAVSPDGNVVTWEHCLASSLNCDVWQAVKSLGSWTVSAVSTNPAPEGNPDTNGALVVYDSQRGTEEDVFWHPVAGGAETQLAIPGFQNNPSIAGNYIAFESRASFLDYTEIFVYDLLTNRLYQITNTPLVNEQLSDITVLPDGRVRVVWASDEEAIGTHNIRAATFQLAADPAAQIGDLITKTLDYLHLPALSIPLRAQLQTAVNQAVAGNRPAVCSALQWYIVAVSALPPGAITPAHKAELIADAMRIRSLLGC